MAPLPDRKTLENMKRTDLQKLCKDYGVKANLKSEALIDLLIDTQKPVLRNVPFRRSVSTRQSSRAGPSRISSVVIHETDDEESDKDKQKRVKHMPQDSKPTSSTRPTRTRKVKDQTRLGVGRPAAAGGAGPRAVTKSQSVSKSKRGKTSQTLERIEATIPEEQETEVQGIAQDDFQHGTPTNDNVFQHSTGTISLDSSLITLASIDKRVADAIRPLHEQMNSFKSGLELINSLKTDFGLLKVQADEIGGLKEKVETLTSLVQELRNRATSPAALDTELSQSKEMLYSDSTKSAPSGETVGMRIQRLSSSDLESLRSKQMNSSRSTSLSLHTSTPHTQSGTAPTLLGKRQRNSVASNMSDDDKEDEVVSDESQPMRKRAKLSQGADRIVTMPRLPEKEEEEEEEEGEEGDQLVLQASGSMMFDGSDPPLEQYTDPSPPTDHLLNFFPPPSPLGPGLNFSRFPATSSANASENQRPFSFSFVPISSTPASGMFMPSFPYPEPPQSPSPAGTHQTGFSNRPGNRPDLFPVTGFPLPGRSSHLSGPTNLGAGTSDRFVDPAALTRHLPESKSAARNGTVTKLAEGSTTEVSQMKRTMYGTELDDDTRFADFGAEGVGNSNGNFWAGGRY